MPLCDNLIFIGIIAKLIIPHVSRYHLKDVIVGKIYFLLVRIKIKHMELAIIKKEVAGNCKRFSILSC